MNTQPQAIDSHRQVDSDIAASFLGISRRQLERWRMTGEGPRFVRMGRKCVRYRIKDLMSFQESHLASNTIGGAV